MSEIDWMDTPLANFDSATRKRADVVSDRDPVLWLLLHQLVHYSGLR